MRLRTSFFVVALADNLRAQVRTGRTDYWTSPGALTMSLPSFTQVAVRGLDHDLLDYSYRSYRSRQETDVQRGHGPVEPERADVAAPAAPRRLLGCHRQDAAARNSWKPASAGDSAGFAVGSFLIAGQQLVPLTPGC